MMMFLLLLLLLSSFFFFFVCGLDYIATTIIVCVLWYFYRYLFRTPQSIVVMFEQLVSINSFKIPRG